jgi:hypothetical protein
MYCWLDVVAFSVYTYAGYKTSAPGISFLISFVPWDTTYQLNVSHEDSRGVVLKTSQAYSCICDILLIVAHMFVNHRKVSHERGIEPCQTSYKTAARS